MCFRFDGVPPQVSSFSFKSKSSSQGGGKRALGNQ